MDAEEELDPKSVAVEESIVGDELVTLDEHGPGALEPKPMASPKAMTPQKRAKHFVSHLPYDPDCEVCVCVCVLQKTQYPTSGHHMNLSELFLYWLGIMVSYVIHRMPRMSPSW